MSFFYIRNSFALVCLCMLSLQSYCIQPLEIQGLKFQPRIIGGTPSIIAYPWMVALKQDEAQFCGGVLIHPYYVLTAAHCLESVAANDINLVIGTNDYTQADQGEVRSANYIISHQAYSLSSLEHDIAVIRLSEPSTKTPINLLSTQQFSENITQNTQLTIMGWGLTNESDDGSSSQLLQQVDVSFQQQSVCSAAYGGLSQGYWDNAYCAGEVSGGKDSCSGDSGGPSVIKIDDQWYLTGLVSWGDGCARAESYGVYTKTSSYIDWIEQRLFALSVLGEPKIGFMAYERSKVGDYSLINNSKKDISLDNYYIEASSANAFELDLNNWSLNNDVVPANSQCSFTVNAMGNNVGEHNGVMVFEYQDSGNVVKLKESLNSKVLSVLDVPQANLPWSFFSGTKTNIDPLTEHSEPWYGINQGADVVLSSGAISHSERSILLTYLNGPQAQENLYLKFDANVSSTFPDVLYITLNEHIYNPVSVSATPAHTLLDATGLNQWFTYGLALEEGLNHVMFLYIKDAQGTGGRDQALLDNFRVCTSLDNSEASCSSAAGFYNNEVIGQLDDPLPSQTLSCTKNKHSYKYQALVAEESEEISPSIHKKSSGGSLAVPFLLGLFLLLFNRSNVRIHKKS